MPMIEDSEYEALINARRLAEGALPSQTLLNKLGAGKNRQKLLELIKEEYPNANIPEIDAARPLLDETRQTREELAALKKQMADDKVADAEKARERELSGFVEKNRATLRSQGWLPEGIEKVEKLMTERGLTDYEAAAALVERMEPKDEPVLPNYDRSWNFTAPDRETEAEDHKMLVSGVNGARRWQGKQIQNFFKEKREGRLVL